jgi:hypothetical protein
MHTDLIRKKSVCIRVQNRSTPSTRHQCQKTHLLIDLRKE